MEAVDRYIPTPTRDVDKPFLMPVEDVFSIKGRGTVGTGRIERGVVKVGENVEIVGLRDTQTSVCTGVEMFNKTLDTGQAGDNVGILLRGVEKKDLVRGMVLAKPHSVTPHTEFDAEIYVLTKDEGGRHTGARLSRPEAPQGQSVQARADEVQPEAPHADAAQRGQEVGRGTRRSRPRGTPPRPAS